MPVGVLTEPANEHGPALDPRFEEFDRTVRPFAVEQGYEMWGDWAGHILSIEGVEFWDHESFGHIDPKTTRTAINLGTKVLRSACELGYFSRAVFTEITVGANFGHELGKIVIGKEYEEFSHDMLQRQDTLRTQAAKYSAGPYLKSLLAHSNSLGYAASYVPRVAKQAYLWGRTGSGYFVHTEVGDCSTVLHHDGLITTDINLERRNIDATIEDFDDGAGMPDYTLRDKFRFWRQGRKENRRRYGYDREKATDIARWMHEVGLRADNCDAEVERVRQQLRDHPLDLRT